VSTSEAAPRQTLSVIDAVVIIAGVVIGAGIFRTPSLVAANSGGTLPYLSLWIAGGMISLIGALCYAELAAAYPDTGGDYHYLRRGFGNSIAFLFAWARLAVIQTGSIAIQAFVVGDYASTLLPLRGSYSPAVYAGLVVAVFTALNIAGLRPGKWVQHGLSWAVVVGLLVIVVVGLALPAETTGAANTEARSDAGDAGSAIGLAMVFVLLTYGGWNEAAYLSAEVRGSRRRIVSVFLWGIGLVTVVYLLANLALLRGLGLDAMAGSDVVAADLMRRHFGEGGAAFISLVIVLAALSTINATIFTGARTSYALGRDFPLFGYLGRWNGAADCPSAALFVQGGIALALVLLGAVTRKGFVTMVEYTAPVFWFFFLAVGISLIVLRYRDPQRPRPFRVPLYPLTPIAFCAVCLYMLRSSLAYTGVGALVGVATLLAGVPLLVISRSARFAQPQPAPAPVPAPAPLPAPAPAYSQPDDLEGDLAHETA
jgi:amino acid transporter